MQVGIKKDQLYVRVWIYYFVYFVNKYSFFFSIFRG